MRSLKKQVKTSKRNTKNNLKKTKSLKKRGGSIMRDILSEVSNKYFKKGGTNGLTVGSYHGRFTVSGKQFETIVCTLTKGEHGPALMLKREKDGFTFLGMKEFPSTVQHTAIINARPPVENGDKIVAVNGVDCSPEEMVKLIRNSENEFQITVQRQVSAATEQDLALDEESAQEAVLDEILGTYKSNRENGLVRISKDSNGLITLKKNKNSSEPMSINEFLAEGKLHYKPYWVTGELTDNQIKWNNGTVYSKITAEEEAAIKALEKEEEAAMKALEKEEADSEIKEPVISILKKYGIDKKTAMEFVESLIENEGYNGKGVFCGPNFGSEWFTRLAATLRSSEKTTELFKELDTKLSIDIMLDNMYD